MDVLLLRFDAPLVSFGGVMVDEIGVTRDVPAKSMIVGLTGNALGYQHADGYALQRLQERLRFAVRCDQPGEPLVDFQTVDLGQDFMSTGGWTTHGCVQQRGGGTASTGTHIRYRHYLADARYTVAITLLPHDEVPDLDRLASAFEEPERPLLGRKSCMPSSPLLLGRLEARNLYEALKKAPKWTHLESTTKTLRAWWPDDEVDAPQESRETYVTDERDWKNQIHVGRRRIREGRVITEEENHDR